MTEKRSKGWAVIRAEAPVMPWEGPVMNPDRCKDATLLDVLFCEPCRVNLANVGQVEMHLEQGGTHRLVRFCNKHRVYEEAEVPSSLQLGVGP